MFIDLSAQAIAYSFSSNVLFSDIASSAYAGGLEEGNTWKRGFELKGGITFRLYKNWLILDASINYDERKALEVFTFPFGEESQQIPRINNVFAFGNVPTSPQSKGFYSHGTQYIHFPNFKYSHITIVPKVIFGHLFSVEAGIGFFGGILLNRNQLIFGEEYFPWSSDFDPPYNVYGEVRYHRYNFGWMSEFSLNYQIHKTWQIGLVGKSYQALARLNDTFVAKNILKSNTRWIAYTLGINLKYILN